jgi:hypothetical protein
MQGALRIDSNQSPKYLLMRERSLLLSRKHFSRILLLLHSYFILLSNFEKGVFRGFGEVGEWLKPTVC